MIKVTNVSKKYDSQWALSDVSFQVSKGEIVGFLGPNGAGKSTMMKIITCYLPATTGQVNVEGYDTLEQSMEVRQQVGYLPEHNPLYLDMYVKEYLSFVAGIHLSKKLINRAVADMIERTGLTPECHKKIGALSKGYRQRVGLAQAMIHDPKVLILDEPTSGLDPNQLAEVRQLIKTIGREKTVILSTHIMQEVTAICNRVIIINKGKIVADDAAQALLKQGTKPVLVIEFAKPVSIPDLKNIAGVIQVESLQANTYRIHAQSDVRETLFAFAVKTQNAVLSMQQENNNLENVFRQLTKN
jgi:ABC-2 type transport system ATP-binding protein